MTEKLQEILKTKCRCFGLTDRQQCKNMSESHQLWIFTCKVGDSLNSSDWKRTAGFHKCFYCFRRWERYNHSNNLQVVNQVLLCYESKRSTKGSDTSMVNTRQAQRLSNGEEKAEVPKQREGKIMHIMAYVTYNAKFQYAILIYNTQNTLHWNLWTCRYKTH